MSFGNHPASIKTCRSCDVPFRMDPGGDCETPDSHRELPHVCAVCHVSGSVEVLQRINNGPWYCVHHLK